MVCVLANSRLLDLLGRTGTIYGRGTMGRGLLLLVLSVLLLTSGTARGQAPSPLSCSPRGDTTAASEPLQVEVDCNVVLTAALSAGGTVNASLFYSPTNEAAFVGCDTDAAVTCNFTPKAATIDCPSPGGCPTTSPYTFAIQLSSDSSREMFGEISVATGSMLGAGGGTRSFVAMLSGWHLVALPPGSDLVGAAGPLFTLHPANQSYERIQPDQATVAGRGYWVYSPQAAVANVATGPNTAVRTVSIGSQLAYRVSIPAGGWALVGNPSGIWDAELDGADAAYTYDPRLGYQLLARPLLPGEAAMVYSEGGTVVSVTPRVP